MDMGLGKLARWGALVGLLAGCSSGNSRFTLFPEGHRLSKTAAALRKEAGVQPLPRELARQVAPPYTVAPGDVLLVQPASLDSPVRLPGDQPVLPDGTIQLGRYGRLPVAGDRKSTRLNSSHLGISYAVFCLKKKRSTW